MCPFHMNHQLKEIPKISHTGVIADFQGGPVLFNELNPVLQYCDVKKESLFLCNSDHLNRDRYELVPKLTRWHTIGTNHSSG